ncbi:unnamed protein product [Pelagomonas calceolata]|uniref:Plastid light harvesting protein n=1 Tax=Pelagomonas calceolata TaxID=35677 RepID=A0A6S8W9B6_9STRA|nr:unnamed protein product [Pelagomonas calceolata]|mmetsp:Transcript_7235/g.20197  ORF Transcript_7235/g.20197 Transcript_7235/m.20197 type:complete len:218 (+) Transcript_7235:65-718(+)
MARLSAVVLALAAPAGALVAPAAPKATVKVQGVSDMIGGTIETAGLWDPLRLSDGASDEQLHRWRCVELKHGRVAMAATVGYLYNDLQLNFPGTLSPSASLKFADVPTGLAATHGFPNSVPIAGWVQIIGFIGVLETTTFKQDPAKEAGNVGGDLFRRYSDPAERETKLISELKNGRLAMMGIMGMLVTDQLTGMGPISWLVKDGSPFGVVGSKLTF